MLFLKRNMQTIDHINIFFSDLDIKKIDFIEECLSDYELEEWANE